MKTHTPGPWGYGPNPFSGGQSFLIDATDQNIAKTLSDNHEANARLIAAAPALLEALEEVSVLCRGYMAAHEGELAHKTEEDHPTWKAYRAAIAQARGEA